MLDDREKMRRLRADPSDMAFLSRDRGFSKEVLEKPQPFYPRQFLHLIPKEYEHDAIGVEYESIGGHTWVFRHGNWRSMPR